MSSKVVTVHHQADNGEAQSKFYFDKNTRIFVAGHTGMVGSAIVRALKGHGYENIIKRTRAEVDLVDHHEVLRFFRDEKPQLVVDAAARVGGIHANETYPADFIRENLQIQNNLITCSHEVDAKKFVFLGSSCIYPKLAPQPLKEDYLLTGELEPTNQWYAIAKLAGIKMCQAYRKQYGFDAIALMPTNLYGPGDNFSLENSHVLPGLIRKFHEAKSNKESSVTIWGTGSPKREFLHVDDMAEATVFLIHNYSDEKIVNVGVGKDISISELSELIKDITEFSGELVYDTDKPNGTPRKLLDVSRLNDLGWKAAINLREGIAETYKWYLRNQDKCRK